VLIALLLLIISLDVRKKQKRSHVNFFEVNGVEKHTEKALNISDISNQEIERIEKFFYQKAKKDLSVTYKNSLLEMKRATLRLEEKYDESVKKARALGVNLNDSNIDNLVKGRLFELFTATKMDEYDSTTILDWTPDKGFNEKIFVKSNGNPDLVVFDEYCQTKVAVECKYRSHFNNNFINFGHEKAINRYRNYQEEKSIRVYILLGIGGKASEPKSLYLLTLDGLDDIKIRNDQFGNITTLRKKLFPFKVDQNELMESLFRGC